VEGEKKHNPPHCLRAKIKSVDKTRNKNFNFFISPSVANT